MSEAAEVSFVNEKTGKVYRAVRFDQDKGKVTLAGETGLEFDVLYSRERFERLGYKLQRA